MTSCGALDISTIIQHIFEKDIVISIEDWNTEIAENILSSDEFWDELEKISLLNKIIAYLVV